MRSCVEPYAFFLPCRLRHACILYLWWLGCIITWWYTSCYTYNHQKETSYANHHHQHILVGNPARCNETKCVRFAIILRSDPSNHKHGDNSIMYVKNVMCSMHTQKCLVYIITFVLSRASILNCTQYNMANMFLFRTADANTQSWILS